MRILRKPLIDWIAYLSTTIFILAGCIVSIHRYWQYEESLIDFGVFDQAIWKVAHFQAPIINHFIYGRINILGDHFAPSVFLLSPLYWFTDKSEVILISQAVIVGLSGFVLYDLAKTVLRDRYAALTVLIMYLLFVGLQNAVITEFHELTVMTLPLMLTLWAFIKKKVPWFYLFLLITLGCKEVIAILGVTLGIAIFFLDKSWRKHAVATICISAIWGILAFKLLIPFFSHTSYLYANNLPNNIFKDVTALFDAPLKRQTLFYSFFSFSFLPFLSPAFWLAILQDYATRFLPSNFVTRWGLGMHYNAQSAVLLAVSSVFGLKYLLTFNSFKKYSKYIFLLIIFNSLFLFRFILHGPYLLAFNDAFYQHSQDFKFLNSMVERVPKSATVMTHNNLATRFTHQDVRLITKEYETVHPDFILLDMRSGQNPNNYFGSTDVPGTFEKLKKDPQYSLIYQTSDQFVFKHKTATQ